jgi:hypothetical protein
VPLVRMTFVYYSLPSFSSSSSSSARVSNTGFGCVCFHADQGTIRSAEIRHDKSASSLTCSPLRVGLRCLGVPEQRLSRLIRMSARHSPEGIYTKVASPHIFFPGGILDKPLNDMLRGAGAHAPTSSRARDGWQRTLRLDGIHTVSLALPFARSVGRLGVAEHGQRVGREDDAGRLRGKRVLDGALARCPGEGERSAFGRRLGRIKDVYRSQRCRCKDLVNEYGQALNATGRSREGGLAYLVDALVPEDPDHASLAHVHLPDAF